MIVKLRVIQGQPVGKTLSFGPGDYFLGRGPECHVRFNSEWVSRQHCQLRVSSAAATLRDLGSRNGTLINGRLLCGEEALRTNDQIQIGALVFEVALEQEVPAAVAESALTLQPEGGTGEPPSGPTAQYPLLKPPEPG